MSSVRDSVANMNLVNYFPRWITAVVWHPSIEGVVECLVHRRLTDEAAQMAVMLGDSMAAMRGGGDVDMEG